MHPEIVAFCVNLVLIISMNVCGSLGYGAIQGTVMNLNVL